MADYDVVVVGAGNAALAAAVSAREQGAGRVAVLEKAPRELRGGNTHSSGGLLRFAYQSGEDLLPLVPDVEAQVPGLPAGVESYPAERFRADLDRVTEGRSDPELAAILIGRSYDTVRWMARQGIAMEAAVSLSGVRVGDTVRWSPGAVIRARHEGVGLSAMRFKAAQERGVDIRYGTGATRLVQDGHGRVTGVVIRDADGISEISARAVVLGCGGLEANPEWRARYPRGVAFQIFDAKVAGLLEGRYRTGTPATADSLKALVEQLPVDRPRCLETLEAYNASVAAGTFDPTIRDGLRTTGLALPKSNWAQRLDTPPFTAWAVTGGITFTFGGVKVDGRAQVQNTSWMPVPGLYACGEMVGGLFHGNDPGGTGLMSGAVFGRIAGASAAGA
jgi:succinate dehydrogenase/fumarate reductase flavoprotein subunit